MCRIDLLVTGDLEERGLAQSLARAFPQAAFTCHKLNESFTSSPVTPRPPDGPVSLVEKSAAALVATLYPGRTGDPPDFAIAIDDLEVVNLHQPEVVVREFRRAVERHIADPKQYPTEATRQRVLERVRDRGSFHLLSPMIESYFFAAPGPLAAAGAAKKPPQLLPNADLEDFTVVDEGYLTPTDSRAKWNTQNRDRHPKHYLQYLIDPLEQDRYRETKQGLAALNAMDWKASVLSAQNEHLRFARSLMLDIALMLELDHAEFGGDPHPTTSQRGGETLRNI